MKYTLTLDSDDLGIKYESFEYALAALRECEARDGRKPNAMIVPEKMYGWDVRYYHTHWEDLAADSLERHKADSQKKYVMLCGFQEHNRFFSLNVKGDPTKLLDGTSAFSVLGYADTVEEAQTKLYGCVMG